MADHKNGKRDRSMAQPSAQPKAEQRAQADAAKAQHDATQAQAQANKPVVEYVYSKALQNIGPEIIGEMWKNEQTKYDAKLALEDAEFKDRTRHAKIVWHILDGVSKDDRIKLSDVNDKKKLQMTLKDRVEVIIGVKVVRGRPDGTWDLEYNPAIRERFPLEGDDPKRPNATEEEKQREWFRGNWAVFIMKCIRSAHTLHACQHDAKVAKELGTVTGVHLLEDGTLKIDGTMAKEHFNMDGGTIALDGAKTYKVKEGDKTRTVDLKAPASFAELDRMSRVISDPSRRAPATPTVSAQGMAGQTIEQTVTEGCKNIYLAINKPAFRVTSQEMYEALAQLRAGIDELLKTRNDVTQRKTA